MKNYILSIIALVLLGNFSSKAQVGFAVAIENGSDVKWVIERGHGTHYNSRKAAEDELKSLGFKKVRGIYPYGSNIELKKGVYVVISTYFLKSGKYRNYFAIGTSPNSYKEAEKNAIECMRKSHADWGNKYGYQVTQSGSF